MFHACRLITMSTISFLWKLRLPYCWGDGRNGASALIWAPRMRTKGYVALQRYRAQDIFLISWFGISGPKRKSPGIRDDCWILLANNDGDNNYEVNNMEFYPHLSIVIETAPLLLILKSPQFAVRVSPFCQNWYQSSWTIKKTRQARKKLNTGNTRKLSRNQAQLEQSQFLQWSGMGSKLRWAHD